MDSFSPPKGNVTFLFTDIEGSTGLWEIHEEKMQAALAGHDALLRRIITGHGGYVFKTVGDAFCAAFSSALAAIAAAIDIQRELGNAPSQDLQLQVRAALHTGVAEERDGDYFGPNVNRVARLLIGSGGQVLMSLATQALVANSLPKQIGLLDLGSHYLKDLREPEHVFQLTHAQLPIDFPPLKSLDAMPNNLPAQLTSFIGRKDMLRTIKERLMTARLLTLTGAGGGGKTRLALQTAANQIERFEHGVWLVELAETVDSKLTAQTTASVLRVREQPGCTVEESLVDFIRPRSILILLDNCEHLAESCARLSEVLLRSCPHLKILATSRAALGVGGENIQVVPPLELPDLVRLPSGDQNEINLAMRSEASRLFCERATAVNPSFIVSANNANAIIDICRRLDGNPFAIELAAARVRVLSAEQIAARLGDRFRLLAGSQRESDIPRQQTLRAMIDWSYDLLTAQEQTLLTRLSIFSGGWTLDAAEAVCADDAIDRDEILDVLAQLVEKSLTFAEERHGAARYRMLETVREYAREKLAASGESADLALRHASLFLQWAHEAEAHLLGDNQAEWLRMMDSECDNLRSALAWFGQSQLHVRDSLQMSSSLWRFWTIRSYLKEGRGWLSSALRQAEHSNGDWPVERAKALTAAGSLAWSQGDYLAARGQFEESLALRRSLSDGQGVADMLNNLGNVATDMGDYSAARPLVEESLAFMRAEGDMEGIAAALSNLARILLCQEDFEEARARYEESLRLDQKRGDDWGVANSLCGLSQVEIRLGEYAAARSRLRESLTLRQLVADQEGIVECLEVYAEFAAAQNQAVRTVCMLTAARRAREILGAPSPPMIRAIYDAMMIAQHNSLSEKDFAEAIAQGNALTIEGAAVLCLEMIGNGADRPTFS
ncbi:MAG: regulatory protein LuxR [Capsulimonas sp.]|nr:regulatory protein LuxR [Capsulimonas sp.]